jgi:hypothetical protein
MIYKTLDTSIENALNGTTEYFIDQRSQNFKGSRCKRSHGVCYII